MNYPQISRMKEITKIRVEKRDQKDNRLYQIKSSFFGKTYNTGKFLGEEQERRLKIRNERGDITADNRNIRNHKKLL